MDLEKNSKSPYMGKLKQMVMGADQLRQHADTPVDVSFEEFAQIHMGITEKEASFDAILESLGIDPQVDTIANIFSVPQDDVRWVVPEIIRTAIRLGLRRSPIWSEITMAETQIKQLKAILPFIKMSDAAPRKVNEGETIPLGTVSYGKKEIHIFKIGRGIALTYEVINYVSLDVLAIFLEDFGMKLGYALDVLAIDCLINGEQADGSESAPVVGVTTANTLVYRDLLRIWIRMSRIGRKADTIIAGETEALNTLDLQEFKMKEQGTPHAKLNLKTPVPSSTNYFIHGNVPANQQIIIDSSAALIKFNAQPLLVESEKIVSNQTQAFYVTLTTGFAKLFRDAVILVDKSVTIGAAPLPAWMNVDLAENVVIE